MPTCAQCATENPDIAKFCLACGAPITVAEKHEEERKPVTAVFVDIVGSTSRAEELDPEEVLRLLEPYYRELRGELERHGGTVEKFIGDAVVAVFGAPIAHGDDALRAVRAALAVLEAIDRLNAEDSTRELAGSKYATPSGNISGRAPGAHPPSVELSRLVMENPGPPKH